jgi:transcriptional regulator with XRE-family HTH domain
MPPKNATMPSPDQPLTVTLQQARKARRLSQLELSLQLGVSQRHISFVESGRARPSRDLLVAWLRALSAPLALGNEALLQAGYAPAYSSATLSDSSLSEANDALERLLRTHDPMPALVLDADWNLLRANRGGQWLAATLLPRAASLPGSAQVNILDALVHPDGLGRSVVNLADVGPAFLAQLRHEASARPALQSRVDAYEALLKARLGEQDVHRAWAAPKAPLLTTRYATPYGELAFFSMFTTFGTPQDITLASLRVEHMFAADDATRAVLTTQVG